MITAKEKLEILSLPEDSPSSRDKAFEIFYNCIYSILEIRNTNKIYVQSFQLSFLGNQILRILKVQNSKKLVESFKEIIIDRLAEIEQMLESHRNQTLSESEGIWVALRDLESDLDWAYLQTVKDHAEFNSSRHLISFLPSQKDKIDQLINNAIELIQADNGLNSKQKSEITKHLEKALKKLEEKDTAAVFGILKETVIIIGAIGSTLGGVAIFLPQAYQQVQEAAQAVEEVNYNFIQSGNGSSYLNLPSATLSFSSVQQLSPSNSNNSTQSVEMKAELVGDRPTQKELMKIVEELDGCAKTDKPAPTDEEVEEMLMERLVEKYK